MNSFSLKIISCDRLFYTGQCEILIFKTVDGEMAIMAHHEPITCAVETGFIKYRIPGETEMRIAVVSDGFIKVGSNEADLVVFSAERPEEIDERRAEAALERAREQLQQKQSIQEYNVSTSSMARAVARLRGVKEYRGL